VFQGFKLLVPARAGMARNPWYIAYWAVSAAGFILILLAFLTKWHEWPRFLRVYPFAVIFILYVSKLFVVVFLIVADGIRALRFVYTFIADRISPTKAEPGLPNISRLKFLTQTGAVIGGIQFISLLYGMARGAYDFRVRKVSLTFPNLPEGFDGIKITQI